MELKEKKNKSCPYIKSLKFQDNKLYLEIDEIYKQIINYRILLIERRTKDKHYIDSKTSENIIVIDLNKFIKDNNTTISRWDFYLEKDNNDLFRLRKKTFHKINSYKRYLDSVYLNNSINIITPYITEKNGISLVINTEQRIFNEILKEEIATKILQVSMKSNILTGKFLINTKNRQEIKVTSLVLKLRNDSKNIKRTIKSDLKRINKGKYIVGFELDLKEPIWESFYWDMFVEFCFDNKEYYIKIKNPNFKVARKINNNISEYEYSFNNGFMIYPYITKDNALALNYRERNYYETEEYRKKEKLAYYLYLLLKPYFDMKNIWLGYEKFAETAQDNGFYFFDYCYKNNKHKNFYYIIKSNSKDLENLKEKNDKVIEFMTFRYMIYMYAAKVLIGSESKGHCYDIRIQKGKLKKTLDKKRIVFLQHGVIGLKKVDNIFKKTLNNKMDLFVVSSEYEKNIIKKYFDYKDKEIIDTGLCRWDALENKSDGIIKEILIMPTWRSWMDGISKHNFIKTDYYKNYFKLLNSEELKQIVEKENIKVNFYIHPKFKEHINEFESKNNVNIYKFGDVELNKLLMRASLLVTDYSSVSWDMYYQKKPVIFFQFDLEQYNMYQGSYMNMEKELFGDRTVDINVLMTTIRYYIANNFIEKKKFSDLRSRYFSHIDDRNCERTFNAIKSKKNQLKFNYIEKYKMILVKILKKLRIIIKRRL